MSTENQRPWVGFMPGEEYEGVIAGNRAGLVRFRELLDESLERKSADLSDLWDDFREIRLLDEIPPEKKESHRLIFLLQVGGAVAVLVFALASLAVGAVQIFKWLL